MPKIRNTYLSITMASFSTTAMADELAKQCYSKAASAAENFASGNYDDGGFWAYECVVAPNQKAVICEVSASKGDGAATDSLWSQLIRLWLFY